MNETDLKHLRRLANKMPVLYVEDEPAFSRIITQRLTDLGFVVTTAHDGLAGWYAFLGQNFPLVVTDFSMPGKTGAELTREIRKKSPQTHIILLTSLQKHEDVKASFIGDTQVYLVAKSGIERPVVGLEDALFMAVARIDTSRDRCEKTAPPMTETKKSTELMPAPVTTTSLGQTGSALQKLRELRVAKDQQ